MAEGNGESGTLTIFRRSLGRAAFRWSLKLYSMAALIILRTPVRTLRSTKCHVSSYMRYDWTRVLRGLGGEWNVRHRSPGTIRSPTSRDLRSLKRSSISQAFPAWVASEARTSHCTPFYQKDLCMLRCRQHLRKTLRFRPQGSPGPVTSVRWRY